MNAVHALAPAASALSRRVTTAPWPHQDEAFTFARPRPGVLLAIPMGGGKTLVTTGLLEDDLAGRDLATRPFRVLVVCPKSVVGVWPSQLEQHAVTGWHTWAGEVPGARGPLKHPSVSRRAVALLDATKRATITRQPFAAIVNFEAVYQGDMARLTLGTDWDVLVVDESHRIKAPTGKASKHVAVIAERVRQRGGRVLCLTGTPMPHSPLDIWAQMRTVDGGRRFGRNYHRFCRQFGHGETIWAPGGRQVIRYREIRDDQLDHFTTLISGVTFHLDQDTLDRQLGLPETVDVHRTIDLDTATRKAYDELEKHLIADLDDGTVITAANSMVLTTRLAQLSGGFSKRPDGELVHFSDQPEKARLLADVLEDIAEPVVVFCRFHHDLDQVRQVTERLGRRYGELSGRRRDGLTPDSKMTPGVEVLGCQLQSGGVGVDFTGARYAIYYSLEFSLGNYLQSRKRVHRPGQTQRCTYIHLLARDTIDWAIWGALRKREHVIEAVLQRLQKGARP